MVTTRSWKRCNDLPDLPKAPQTLSQCVPAQSAAHSPGEEENQHKKPQNSEIRRPAPNSGNDSVQKRREKKDGQKHLHSFKLRNKVPISLSSGTPARIIKKTSLRRCECVPQETDKKGAKNAPATSQRNLRHHGRSQACTRLGDHTTGLKLTLHHWDIAIRCASYPGELP